MRTWLNNDFINEAFTSEEQKAILMTWVDNSSAQGYSNWNTTSGNNIQDRIFLLSYAEANKYLKVTVGNKNKKSRVAPTDAIAQRVYTNNNYWTEDNNPAGWWWLRSPGGRQDLAAYVSSNGSLDYASVYRFDVVVRPAFWLDLESDIF